MTGFTGSARWSSNGHAKTRSDSEFTGRLDFNQHAHKQTLEEDTGSIPLQPAA